MPATETAVRTLAASFEGMGGATALSLIAFSIVFLVLASLTLVIFAMRYITRLTGHAAEEPAPVAKKAPAPKPAPAPIPAPAPAPKPAPVAVAPASADEELVAVIAAAIAAHTGAMMAVTSIAPVVPVRTFAPVADAWVSTGRIEGLQGNLPCRW